MTKIKGTVVAMAAAATTLLASCSSSDKAAEPDASGAPIPSSDPCPLADWNRNAQLTARAAEWAASPKEAAIATGGANTEIVRVDRLTPRLAEVDVVRNGEEGTFGVERIRGRWVVVSGTGCGTATLANGTSYSRCESLLTAEDYEAWAACMADPEQTPD